MKFGSEYAQALQKGEYPEQWISSAISYKKLKKCIKRVQQELIALGLEPKILDALWQHVDEQAVVDSTDSNGTRMMHYRVSADGSKTFVPKLTIALDPGDGAPMDAWLSPETKKILAQVGKRTLSAAKRESRPCIPQETGTRIGTEDGVSQESIDSSLLAPTNSIDSRRPSMSPSQFYSKREIETVEIPLTSDSEFFQILRVELQRLETLQNTESKQITDEIESLSSDLQLVKTIAAKKRGSKSSKSELNTWREIFRLYIESEIFLSSHEQDAGTRSPERAQRQYEFFLKGIAKIPVQQRQTSRDTHVALDRFLNINNSLIRLLKFQELNKRALGKILKKFDKRTSLHSAASFHNSPIDEARAMVKAMSVHPDTNPILSPAELARSTAYTISSSLLSLIPQFDDYMCPICTMISYKPVRLHCGHIFCVRCMVTMQKNNKDECPFCREKVVLAATTDEVDYKLAAFLKREFPDEVKEKKRENDLAAGKELFGESYTGTHKCVIM